MTKILRFAVIAAMCLVGACLANAQYTQPSNPNYGNNKIGLCYSSTLNSWVGISNTPANTAAYSNQCDQYGNLVAFAQGQTVTTAAPGSVRGIVVYPTFCLRFQTPSSGMSGQSCARRAICFSEILAFR